MVEAEVYGFLCALCLCPEFVRILLYEGCDLRQPPLRYGLFVHAESEGMLVEDFLLHQDIENLLFFRWRWRPPAFLQELLPGEVNAIPGNDQPRSLFERTDGSLLHRGNKEQSADHEEMKRRRAEHIHLSGVYQMGELHALSAP